MQYIRQVYPQEGNTRGVDTPQPLLVSAEVVSTEVPEGSQLPQQARRGSGPGGAQAVHGRGTERRGRRQHAVEVVQLAQSHRHLDQAGDHRHSLFQVLALHYPFLHPAGKLEIGEFGHFQL